MVLDFVFSGYRDPADTTLVGKAEDAMTVKQLIRKLQHPPCERIAAVRIEFVDGGIYEASPGMRRNGSIPPQTKKRRVPRVPVFGTRVLGCSSSSLPDY